MLEVPNLPTGRHYLPSRPSAISSLFRSTEESLARLPDMLDRADRLLLTAQEKIEEIEVGEINDRLTAVLAASETALERVDATLAQYQTDSGPVGDLIQNTTAVTARLEHLLEEGGSIDRVFTRIDQAMAEDGAITSVLRELSQALDTDTRDSLAQRGSRMMDRTTLLAEDLRSLLPTIQSSLGQLQQFIRDLDAEPEQVLFGPRPHPEDAP